VVRRTESEIQVRRPTVVTDFLRTVYMPHLRNTIRKLTIKPFTQRVS